MHSFRPSPSSRSILLALAVFPLCIAAQTTAVTEAGDTIYVYNNGRWSYEPDLDLLEEDTELTFLEATYAIDTTSATFTTPTGSDKLLSGARDFYRVNYTDSLWRRVPPGELNEEAEFALKSREGDIFCILLSEEMSMGTDVIMKIAMNNMEKFAKTSPQVRKNELREVNGTRVLNSVYDINLSGLELTFHTYFFSNDRGTLQFTTWTGANLYEERREQIEDLLNGLVILN